MNPILNDRKFQIPRKWSNRELRKFSYLFSGDIINVSGWKDQDKEGKRYKDYFKNCSKYFVSNYESDARGFQGNLENEFFLDLEKNLPKKYQKFFDVVFNHTVLEHIYDYRTAFANICKMSKDIVIIVVPFLQEMHAKYGDYWRFTPVTIKKMFEDQKMTPLYINFNRNPKSSVYVFAIASKNPKKWNRKITITKELKDYKKFYNYSLKIGNKSIINHPIFNVLKKLFKIFR